MGVSRWTRRSYSLGALVSLLATLGAGAASAAAPHVALNCRRQQACVATLTRATPAPALASPFSALPTIGSAHTAPSFTWSGAAPMTSSAAAHWSNTANWVGGVAPGGSVGTLTFPALTTPGCTSSPPTDACYQSTNDLTGLSAASLSIDKGKNYLVSGNALKLGAGGLSAGSATTFGNPQLTLPITLTAPQTWSVTGSNGQLTVGNVTGAADALTLSVSQGGILSESRDIEVGPVTVNTNTALSPVGGLVVLDPGAKLNGTDGHAVTLNGLATTFFVPGRGTIGPLTASNGSSQIGNGAFAAGLLTAAGAATLGSQFALTLNIVHPGTTAGTDYSQLKAAGAVNLGSATLRFNGSTSMSQGTCPTLHPGDVDTVLTTSGALTGTFGGVVNGGQLPVRCSAGIEPIVRINYTTNSVTATVLTGGGAPSISGVRPNAGPTIGGNTVTIAGANFSSTSTVKFGTTAATPVTFVSPTKLTVAAPAHAAGVVPVRVTTNGATSAASNHDLYAYGPPTVSSFTPTSGAVGTVVTVTGTNFVPGATAKVGASSATATTYVSPTQLKVSVPTGATTGPISVTTVAGTGASSMSFTVT